MNGKLNRAGAMALVATASLTGTVMLGATPAAAVTSCGGYQSKEFATPGYNVDVKIRFCIQKAADNAVHTAYAEGSWGDAGGGGKFDQFTVIVRAERSDVIKNSNGCNLTSVINTYESGTFNVNGDSHNMSTCRSRASSTSSLTGGWTADGSVTYDLNEDGKSTFTWDLTGSPSIN